jgi:hypothetical protein
VRAGGLVWLVVSLAGCSVFRETVKTRCEIHDLKSDMQLQRLKIQKSRLEAERQRLATCAGNPAACGTPAPAPSAEPEGMSSCAQFRADQDGKALVFIYDGYLQTVDPASDIQYDVRPAYLCIEHPNYAVRYQVASSSSALPAFDTSNGLLEVLTQAAAGTSAAKPGGAGGPPPLKTAIDAIRHGSVPDKALLADATFRDATADFLVNGSPDEAKAKDRAKIRARLQGVVAAVKKKIPAATRTGDVTSALAGAPDAALWTKALVDEGFARAVVEDLIATSKNAYLAALEARLALVVPPPDPLQPAREAIQKAARIVQARVETLIGESYLSQAQMTALLADVEAQLAPVTTAQKALVGSKADGDDVLVTTADRLLNTIRAIRTHFDGFNGGILRVPIAIEKDKATTIVVNVKKWKRRDSAGDGAESILIYDDSKESARATVEVHSLVYVKVSLGLVWSQLVDPSFSLGSNDLGAQVIQSSAASSIVPLLLLSHYWYGADLRATQPWDTHRKYWWVNLLPTFALGIPLTKNPIENVFIGAQLQPVPGLSLVAGANVGKVHALRSGFVIGAAPPDSRVGFRIEDAVEERFRTGFFIGAALSDSLFIKLILALTGNPK